MIPGPLILAPEARERAVDAISSIMVKELSEPVTADDVLDAVLAVLGDVVMAEAFFENGEFPQGEAKKYAKHVGYHGVKRQPSGDTTVAHKYLFSPSVGIVYLTRKGDGP